MENIKLKNRLIKTYQNMDESIYEDDEKWSAEELAGYFLYNCSSDEFKHDEFKDIKNECEKRKEAWNLIKKVIYPYSYFIHWSDDLAE